VDDDALTPEILFFRWVNLTEQRWVIFRERRSVIPSQFSNAHDFHDGFASVAVRTTQPGANAAAEWIDRTGKSVYRREAHQEENLLSLRPPSIQADFSEGMLPILEGGLWGVIDRNFHWAIPPRYASRVGDHHDGLASVWMGGHGEFIDKTGKTVISMGDGQSGGDFLDGMASVSDHGVTHGVMDRNGRLVIPIRYSQTESLGEGYAAAGGPSEGGMAIFDRTGKQLAPFRFLVVYRFNGGLAPATKGGGHPLYGYVNPAGAWVIPPQFSAAFSFSGDLARVVLKSGDFGYVNRSGKVVWSGGHFNPCYTL
jgi:hypothetical protein